jgi:hypothetical protein
MTKKKIKPIVIGQDYIKIQRKINRELELERNGGRWVAVKKVHKSKKDYNRKRGKKVITDNLASLFVYV